MLTTLSFTGLLALALLGAALFVFLTLLAVEHITERVERFRHEHWRQTAAARLEDYERWVSFEFPEASAALGMVRQDVCDGGFRSGHTFRETLRHDRSRRREQAPKES